MLDAALMDEVPQTAGAAFEQVVELRQTQVLRIAYRVVGNWADAEDVAQEAFVRLHRHGMDFASDGALNWWLYRVTVNLCLDRLRDRRPSEEIAGLASREGSAELDAIREQEKRQLMSALATLPTKERAAIVLREIEGLSSAEVAKILGSSEGTVRSQVSHAIVRLREIMGAREKAV